MAGPAFEGPIQPHEASSRTFNDSIDLDRAKLRNRACPCRAELESMQTQNLQRCQRGTTHRLWRLGAAMTWALLAACGGGGGGSAGDSQTAKPTLNADVYPLAVGNRYSWKETAGTSIGKVRSSRVTGILQLDGRTAYVTLDDTDGTDYVVRNASGVSSVPGPESDDYTKALGALELMRFGQVAGETLVTMDRSLSFDFNGDGKLDTADIRFDSVFVGYEDITTSLGSLKATAHMRISGRFNYRFAGQTTPQVAVTTLELWLAPGIGPVRATTTVVFDGAKPDVSSEDLISYVFGS
jgi:hypothetical protein